MPQSPKLTSVVAHPPFDAVVDARKAFIIVDDFVSDTGVFAVSGDSLEGAQGVALVDASGFALDADLWIPEDTDLAAIGITYRAQLPTATSELQVILGDVEVDIDVGQPINVTDGTDTVNSNVTALQGEWYTVHLVVSATDVSINVNSAPEWYHIEDPQHSTGAQAFSVEGVATTNEALLDFVVIQQLTQRGGTSYGIQ